MAIRRLTLVSWKDECLEAFASFHLDHFRGIRGRTRVFDLSARDVLLQACSNLDEFAAVNIETLYLEACHGVALDSLENVSGLRTLHLLGRKQLPDVAFVAQCPELADLVITATPLSRTDLSALARAPSLRKLFLTVSDSAVARVAAGLPRVVVTNGDVCFVGGERQPDTSAYYGQGGAR